MAKRILNIVCVILSVTAVLLCGCDREQTGESIITNFKGEFSAAGRVLTLLFQAGNTQRTANT